MKATRVRKAPKIDPPKPSAVVPLRDPSVARKALLASLDPADAITLDDVVIVARHGKEYEKLVLTGEELAHVLSLRDHYNNTFHMCDGGAVNLMLRGMAELLMGKEGEGNDQIGSDGAYFLSNVLDDLAARLEASGSVDAFSVFLRAKSAAGKAGAA